MKFLRQVLHIARYELAFVLRFPKMLIASLAVTLIPALFTILYLSSVWDPSANSRALPVGLVNLDQDVTYRNDVFNMGRDVVAELKERAQFGFMELDDEATARDQVRRGHLAFALIIPSDFSSNALPGAAPGAGKLTVFTSAGNSYESASLARQFDQELTQQVNEKLNERRWTLVLTEASGSQDRLTQLRTGMERLRDGALDLSAGGQTAATATAQLLEGTQKLQLGVDQSTEGFKKLGEAVRQMESQLPPADDLRSLNRGAAALAQGHKEYQTSLIQIRQGQQQLLSGVVGYQSEAASSFFTPARLNEGLDELVAGMTQLDTGLAASLEAHQKLSQGATQVSSGVTSLVFGIRDYRVGMRNLVARLPDEPTLDQLSQGSHEVTKGVERLQRGAEALSAAQKRLALGMELVVNVLPESPLTPLSDNPSGLAHSVDSVLEDEAPVLNHGSGFAPNIIPAALWLGAGIAAFLIHVRLQPRQAQVFHPVAQLMGKVTFPALIVLVQAGFGADHRGVGFGHTRGALGWLELDAGPIGPEFHADRDGLGAGHWRCGQGLVHGAAYPPNFGLWRVAARRAERQPVRVGQPMVAHDLGGQRHQSQHVWSFQPRMGHPPALDLRLRCIGLGGVGLHWALAVYGSLFHAQACH
ncbi:MAG: YhgE/Pip domain-containing protein [Betaproteobacteria bacterium]|nr:YhgE/Pip domain-containing protein [Betaproteobacteria bacterium]